MAADLDELLALPREERMRLAEALLESAAPEMGPLLKEFARGLKRTNRALDLAIARLMAFDERLQRSRAEVREAVLRSGETWPFPVRR